MVDNEKRGEAKNLDTCCQFLQLPANFPSEQKMCVCVCVLVDVRYYLQFYFSTPPGVPKHMVTVQETATRLNQRSQPEHMNIVLSHTCRHRNDSF